MELQRTPGLSEADARIRFCTWFALPLTFEGKTLSTKESSFSSDPVYSQRPCLQRSVPGSCHPGYGRSLYPARQTQLHQNLPSHRRRSEEHTSELQSRGHLVCRLLLEKKKQPLKERPKVT